MALKWKTTADFGITHISFIFLFSDSKPGSCQPIYGIIITIKTFRSAKAALFVLFALVERTAAMLDVAMLCAVEGAQYKTRELT